MRAAVLGSPIGHSLSPALHRAAYAELGLAWTYDAFEVDEAGLDAFLERLDADWRGLSLTMPLKRAVLRRCSSVSSAVREVEAANTVLRAPDGSLSGDNTDVPGMTEALLDAGADDVGSATIVGGGATAASAVASVRALGARRVTVVSREPERAAGVVRLAQAYRLDVEAERLAGWVPQPCDVAVSTVPAAAQGDWAPALVATAGLVHDVIYDPWETPLVQAGRETGRLVVGGFELLVRQAGLQVALMTGCRSDEVPLTSMRAAGLRALAAR